MKPKASATTIYEAIEAVMTAADPLLLLIGNPTTVTGAFRRAFYEERQLYHNITISALDSPNVKAGKTLVPGLTSANGWRNAARPGAKTTPSSGPGCWANSQAKLKTL